MPLIRATRVNTHNCNDGTRDSVVIGVGDFFMETRCGVPADETALGCTARQLENPDDTTSDLQGIVVGLSYTYPNLWNTPANSSCDTLYRTVLHEGGHVFGIENHNTVSTYSIMSEAVSDDCAPKPYDIAAVTTWFQSR